MNVAFVLHGHLPWLRRNGTFPAGEEWLFQAWSESYLPLLDVLERLADRGARDVVTLGFTPVLAEQMDDPYLLAEFHGWLARRLLDLQHTVARYRGPDRAALTDVWRDHWRRQTALLDTVERRVLRDGLLAPFRALADTGVVELLGGPATHPYLPLLDDPALLRGQIAGGLAVAERTFGRRPRGVWTPECAYRPAGPVLDPLSPTATTGAVLPGLEQFWAEAGVDHLVVDGPTLARAVGAPDRDWAGTGGDVVAPGDPLDVLDAPVLIGDSDVAAFGRNLAVSYAVWNPNGGYPTDPAYRDFFRVDMEGGFKSWGVTALDRWDKQPYDARAADARARAHADDVMALLHRHLDVRPADRVVVAAYDTELFGHWWHEGPRWLAAVFDRLLADPTLRPTTLQRHLGRGPALRRLALPESSWGAGKSHAAWVNDRTRWIWAAVRGAEARFRALTDDGPARDAAWRQLTLLQASDWPFLVTRDQSTQYAEERVRAHLDRFDAACRGEGLAALAERDGTARAPAVALTS